jgi:hypothetical protein
MGRYTTILSEVYQRLYTATATGKPLAAVKTLQVGLRAEVKGQDETPAIFIGLDSINEHYEVIRSGQKTADISFIVTLIYAVPDESETNILQNTTTSTGFLYFLEDVLDVLHTNRTTDALDPRLAESCWRAMDVSTGGITKVGQGLYRIDIRIVAKSAQFTINSR